MAKPDYIYLVRHGESVGNVKRDTYNTVPDWKIPLTTKGIKQARDAGKKLVEKIGIGDVAMYCSPWIRARQTAAEIRKKLRVVKYYEDPRLREQEWGNYREPPLAKKIERERYKFGSFFYRMPYGESGADVFDRISSFFDTLYRDFEDFIYPRNIIIVTHGLTIKTFLMRFYHWSVEDFDSYKTPGNCVVIEMEKQYEKYTLNTKLRKRPGRKAK